MKHELVLTDELLDYLAEWFLQAEGTEGMTFQNFIYQYEEFGPYFMRDCYGKPSKLVGF